MVKVRYVVGGSANLQGSLSANVPGSLAGGSSELAAGASTPWFRPFYTVPLNFFVVYVISALGFLGAAIYNFVDVHTETATASQNTMSIIFLVLAVWFVMGWPLVVYSLA